MLAVECASELTQRLNLLHSPIRKSDRQAVSEALQADLSGRCPQMPLSAGPATVEKLLNHAGELCGDQLIGVWMLAREDISKEPSDVQKLWLAQVTRRLMPRSVFRSLFGLDRAATLKLIGNRDVVEETRRQQEVGLCDNHLHSGAADELGDVLARLVPRVVERSNPRKLSEAVGVPARGGPSLNAGPIVLGLAAACTLLKCDGDSGLRSQQLLEDAAWWRDIRERAYDDEVDPDKFKALRTPIRELSVALRTSPQLSDLSTAVRDVVRGTERREMRLEAVRRGLISLATLYSLITIPHHSRLGTFVLRFDLLRQVRGIFGDDSDRLSSALQTMYLEGKVSSIELRKSIFAESARTISVARIRSSIDKDIREHASSALAACRALEHADLHVRMPLTFTRREADSEELKAEPRTFVPFRYPVGETLAVADAIAQATREDHICRFVGAVDVVGDEQKVPNWLYALAYQRIASAQSKLEFACHAGEYFGDQAEGLRRIAEVNFFRPAVVRRIGHCLALGIEDGVNSAGVNEEPLIQLENATWAALVLSGSSDTGLGSLPAPPPPALERELKRVMLRLASAVFGASGITVRDVFAWYLGRFDSKVMSPWIAGLQKEPLRTRAWPRGTRRSMIRQARNMVEAMLATSVYETTVEIGKKGSRRRIAFDPKADVPRALLEETVGLMGEAKSFTQERVRAWLVDREVVIESCPSSNTALTDLTITDHPIWDFHEGKLLCSVNTDDPALFGASLAEEYAHVGMVADGRGGSGKAFIEAVAEISRSHGMIQRALCDDSRSPAEAYRRIARSR